MPDPLTTASIIDQHRIKSTAQGDYRRRGGRRIYCMCGHSSTAYYDEQEMPLTDENNPERITQQMHAEHVAQMVEKHMEDSRWQAEIQHQKVEHMRSLGAPGATFRAVERSTATKFQIQTFEREYPELVVKDLLTRAAREIAEHENIPTQIKIDRAPAGQGEKITLTWFA